jgi:hypothetical protein
MDGLLARESLASIAFGLAKQIAPEVFTQLSPAASAAVINAFAELDTVAALRQAEAVKAAARAPASVPIGVDDQGAFAFAVPAEDIDRADDAGALAESTAALAEASLKAPPGTAPVLAHPGEVSSLALLSIAHSAREGCILLRAIAAAMEIRTAPSMTINNAGGG